MRIVVQRRITMPKSSKKQIDEDDKKLLKVLQTSSGDNIENIAKRCGFSRQKLWRIKKRLEKDKTIWGYNAVIDDEKAGVKRYQILLKKAPKAILDKMMDVMLEKDMRKQLEKFGVEFDCSFYIHGYFDWSLCITAPNIIAVKKFIEILKTKFGEHISEIQVLEVIFPLLKSGFDNPNREEFREYF